MSDDGRCPTCRRLPPGGASPKRQIPPETVAAIREAWANRDHRTAQIDIARQFGVSRTTVSKYLRDHD